MREPVLSKRQFVPRYIAGEFGNASPTWDTLWDWMDACPWRRLGDEQRYHIRNRVAGGPTWYNLECNSVSPRWFWATRHERCEPSQLYISAMAPHERNLLQGEVTRMPGGLYLFGSTAKYLPMREALASDSISLSGLSARLAIRGAMNDLSYQWLEYLLEEYPDHVIEFSSFSRCWGTLEGYNTVFWECRAY